MAWEIYLVSTKKNASEIPVAFFYKKKKKKKKCV